MEVNDALIRQLATLSRLDINAAEQEEIRHDLQRMITFVEKLGELDTTNVKPNRSPDCTNVVAPDRHRRQC